jgi:hypothetical protein
VAPRLLVLCAALALVPTLGWAEDGLASRPWVPGQSGFVVSADLGGGTAVGASSQYTPGWRSELELIGGYEFPYGIRPEFGLVLGFAPTWFGALRPGVHVTLPDLPLYVRAALDWSSIDGVLQLRWLHGGVGAETRLTGMLSGFAEVDLGMPLRNDSGVSMMIRAGIALRL